MEIISSQGHLQWILRVTMTETVYYMGPLTPTVYYLILLIFNVLISNTYSVKYLSLH